VTVLVAAYGIAGRWELLRTGAWQPHGTNIFFRLYALHELPYLLVLALFAAATALLAWRGARRGVDATSSLDTLAPPSAAMVGAIALAVFIVTLAATHLVMHELLFSMDEFSADFQARAFARGQSAPLIPLPWRSIGVALAPIFVRFNTDTGRWVSMYMPVYAMLKAPFIVLGLPTVLNPLLGAGSIAALAAAARRIWPDEGLRPWVAVTLLATSSQLLITSATGYSMPAHLLLNLVWLWLYLRDDTASWIALLVVGVLALGLHNPVPHALFAAPFLLRLVRDRRWARAASAAVVYLAGGVMWLTWLRWVNPGTASTDTGMLHLFAIPNLFGVWLHGMNVTLLFTWHAPVLGLLALIALARPRLLSPVLQDVALGVVLTIGFYMLYPSTQGHGWGYRYAYQVIGNIALLAAAGAPAVRAALGDVWTRRWLSAALALTVLVELPMRFTETERFVRPFAAGNAYVRSRDADVVFVHGDRIWYGADLVRNDPFLVRPIVVRANFLAPGSADVMRQAIRGRVLEISDDELLQLGMTPAASGH